MSMTPESGTTQEGGKPLKLSVMQKEGTLQLPNEIINQVLSHLHPLDALSLGSTCHHLREVVNKQAKEISQPIVQRERTRMITGISLSGLSLLSAIRVWMLHHGPTAEKSFFATSLRIANNYMAENGIDLQDTGYQGDRVFFARAVEYLLHVNYLAHYGAEDLNVGRSTRSASNRKHRCQWTQSDRRTCSCLMCSAYRDEKGSPCCWMETAVREFKKCGWEGESKPLAFWMHINSPVTKKLVGEEEWLDMVQGILAEPLEDPLDEEKQKMNNALETQIKRGFGAAWRTQRDPVKAFFRLAQLPQQRLDDFKVLVPRMNMVEKRRFFSTGTGCWQMARNTLGARAAKEFCMRYGGSLKDEKKLLDPESRLLVAVMYEELHLVSGEMMELDDF
ncbi:hypothetical protein PRZ48_012245 [Zasmidium cellare]|uniref:F-box domain-containing protein n=1 Tax=Zasmidium cellare TaxID=395010 RepID=A0ABR0E4A4_ZASCE|nr:hypothetical protein PRZ48_012245 [Zasmidium cellare]